jgi:hypothetical protein
MRQGNASRQCVKAMRQGNASRLANQPRQAEHQPKPGYLLTKVGSLGQGGVAIAALVMPLDIWLDVLLDVLLDVPMMSCSQQFNLVRTMSPG